MIRNRDTQFERKNNSDIDSVSIVGYSMNPIVCEKTKVPRFQVCLKNGMSKLCSYRDDDFSIVKAIYEEIERRRKFERYIQR